MEPTEASPNLKPSKHAWYTAVFVVLVVSLLANIIECLADRPLAFRTAIDGLEYLFYVIGRMTVTIAVGATTLVGALALLFFFDGWISKAIVTCILGVWTLRQATVLKRTFDEHHERTAISAPRDLVSPAAELPQPSFSTQSKPMRRADRRNISRVAVKEAH